MSLINDPFARLAKKVCLFAFLLLSLSAAAHSQQQELSSLLNELPACSLLRQRLETLRGNGVDEPYMEKMRKQGVKRAAIEVQASYRKGWVEDVHIVRRLYFNQFDGPDSQISSASILKRIDDSGLQTELDRAVIDRAKVAPVKGPVDSPPLSFRHRFHYVWTLVQIYSDPAFPQEKTLLYPTGHKTATLNDAVLFGDALETQKLLQAKRFKQGELDYTLFSAVMSDFDNTTSIRLLLGAGASANSRAGDQSTPLMVAVARPCNIRPLLDGGADRDARDSSGRTAIEIARQQRVIVSVQLLEQAGAR